LSQFPVDVVKIDRSFVANVVGESVSNAIVAAVIALSHTLGMTVVAEGVETADQYDALLELGCDSCQGYHFAEPRTADDLVSLIQDP
jgi:EAL domain-containing protein (putative c-di-GMP-specific phosphodiesterase class I)